MKTLTPKSILKVALVLITSLATLTGSANASATYGQASDLFNQGAGARSLAMGGAFTAVSDDASAPYFNPAGLAYMDEHQLMVMHAPLFIDSSYNYIASANPLGDRLGALALSDAMILSNGYSLRDKFNNETDSDGSLNNNAIFASYAHKITQRMSFGLNTKFIQQKMAGLSGSTLGLDAGLMYKPFRTITVGAMFANVNEPSIKLQTDRDVYRPITRLGVASEVFRNRLTLSFDMSKISHEDNLYAAGAEWAVNKFFSLRTGYNANRSYTLGLGANIRKFRVDYAFSDTDIGAFNKVSITWAWHNIYKTDIEPPMKEGRAVYPLSGFENKVVFKTDVPSQMVARWTLQIKNQEGKEVRTLQGDLRPPENIEWDAKNSLGEPAVDGTYAYHFQVNYKNGKTWSNDGDLKLALPDHERKEVLDMSLQLNGAKENELTANKMPQTAPTSPVAAQETPAAPAQDAAPAVAVDEAPVATETAPAAEEAAPATTNSNETTPQHEAVPAAQ